jgi:hypothetical protein
MKNRNYRNAWENAYKIRQGSSTFYKITQLYIKDHTRKFSFAYKFFMGLKFFMEGYMIVMWVVIYVVNRRVGQASAEKLYFIFGAVQIVLAIFLRFHFGLNDKKTKYERSCGL